MGKKKKVIAAKWNFFLLTSYLKMYRSIERYKKEDKKM